MAKIIWTDRALNDLENIGNYISQDSFKYAKITLQRILESAKLVETNPKIGRVVHEIGNKNIREVIMGRYRIIYHLEGIDLVSILTIHHSSRNFSSKSIG